MHSERIICNCNTEIKGERIASINSNTIYAKNLEKIGLGDRKGVR